jgi:hypothetical protein
MFSEADGKIKTRRPFEVDAVTFESDFKLSWYEMFQVKKIFSALISSLFLN